MSSRTPAADAPGRREAQVMRDERGEIDRDLRFLQPLERQDDEGDVYALVPLSLSLTAAGDERRRTAR